MATVATTNRPAARAGVLDGVTVAMLTVAAFLAILALLAWQLRSAPARPARRMVVVRRVYETRVVETVVGGARSASSVTQSVPSSRGALSAAPTGATTRTS